MAKGVVLFVLPKGKSNNQEEQTMKKKVIVTGLLMTLMLQSAVSAAEIKTYGQDKNDNPYFVEHESKITLDANGGYLGSGYIGTQNKIEITTEKGKIELPIPYRTSDYDFEGWYTEDGDKVTSDTEYYTDATLYAKWNIIGERTITFSSDGGTDILPITAKYGETVSIASLIPTKPGFAFKGWYTDARTKENRVTEITLTDDITAYAKWEQVSHTVNTIRKDWIYWTDEEIAMNQEIMKNQYKPTYSTEQILKLIQMLQQILMEIK